MTPLPQRGGGGGGGFTLTISVETGDEPPLFEHWRLYVYVHAVEYEGTKVAGPDAKLVAFQVAFTGDELKVQEVGALLTVQEMGVVTETGPPLDGSWMVWDAGMTETVGAAGFDMTMV